MNQGQTNRLLGYPVEARLLIINADDFGMCHAINAAIIQALQHGVLRSTTVMMPCPWALHALHFLADHPAIPFGVHLTAISDWVDYRWGPVTPRDKVPSLIDRAGYFHDFEHMPEFLAHVNLNQLELEFRAQIEAVLGAGLKPTHLDWHSLRIDGRADIVDLMLRLAREYRLALRVRGRAGIDRVQGQGLPCNDYDFLDSYHIDPLTKATGYAELLHELPVGLTEWAIHPGLDSAELLAMEPGGDHRRQTDFDFLMSPQALEVIRAEGIILLDYRALQAVWSAT